MQGEGSGSNPLSCSLRFWTQLVETSGDQLLPGGPNPGPQISCEPHPVHSPEAGSSGYRSCCRGRGRGRGCDSQSPGVPAQYVTCPEHGQVISELTLNPGLAVPWPLSLWAAPSYARLAAPAAHAFIGFLKTVTCLSDTPISPPNQQWLEAKS